MSDNDVQSTSPGAQVPMFESGDGVHGAAPSGMWWLAWRLHRTRLLCVGIVLLIISAAVFLLRVLAESAYARANPQCSALGLPDAERCSAGSHSLWRLGQLQEWLETVLIAGPILTGVVLGAVLVSQERERGTAVLALTQSVTRFRWSPW